MPDTTQEEPSQAAQTLRFQDDPGARRSVWIAAGLVALTIAWFASGLVGTGGTEEDQVMAEGAGLVQVAVRQSVATAVAETLILEGQASPERETSVPAETSGRIVDLPVVKGDTLATGDLIARLDDATLQIALARAEAEYERAARDFANAQTLLERGIGTVDRVASARAVLAGAEAQLAQGRDALADAEIRAPFGGRLEDLAVNAGEFVTAGSVVAEIVDNAPLTVRARIAQQSVARIEAGQVAHVAFITGETRMGEVAFVGAHADAATRTFPLEVLVENVDGAIPSGVSARIRIDTGQTNGHFVSPALLALDEAGVLGLKAVDDDGLVVFHEVQVIRAESSGVWVTGPPDEVVLITVGQGFVRSGEAVDAHPEGAALEASFGERP